MRLRRVSFLACLLLAGCQVYTSSLLEGSRDAGSEATAGSGGQSNDAGGAGGTGGAAAGSGGTAGDGSTCNPIHPPPRPTQASAADAGPGDIVFVLKDILLDQGGDKWRSIGYDLDDLCSNPPNPQVECNAPSGGPPEIDGVRGTDNAFGHDVFPLVKATDPNAQQQAQDAQTAGHSNIVLHISGWNGADNDQSVNVWMSQSIYAIPAGSTTAGQPNWDGTDRFYVDKNDFNDGTLNTPLIDNNNAYIAGRVLVFRLPERVPIHFQTANGTFVLKLTDGTLTGKISSDDKSMAPVIIAGRWSLNDIAQNFNQLGLCVGSLQRQLADNLMNNTADVRSTPGTGGPGAICDAISVGLQLTGYRELVGGLATAPSVPPKCGPDGGTLDGGI